MVSTIITMYDYHQNHYEHDLSYSKSSLTPIVFHYELSCPFKLIIPASLRPFECLIDGIIPIDFVKTSPLQSLTWKITAFAAEAIVAIAKIVEAHTVGAFGHLWMTSITITTFQLKRHLV